MNCKPGDLAVIVACPPVPDAVGKVVECVRFVGQYLVEGVTYTDVWELRWGDKDAREIWGTEGWGCPDEWLRPIRDPGEDATDEMLLLVGRPNERVPA